MKKANAIIRQHAKAKGVKLWQLAAALHINDGNLSRKLRFELPEDEKQRILSIIDDIAAQKENAAQSAATR
ncbi:MAG: hypothetical protein ACI4FO_03200 [Acutalibacteraceae bacterium]